MREKETLEKTIEIERGMFFLSLQMVTLYVLFVDSPNNDFRVVLHSIVKTTMEVMKTRLQALVQWWLSFI